MNTQSRKYSNECFVETIEESFDRNIIQPLYGIELLEKNVSHDFFNTI